MKNIFNKQLTIKEIWLTSFKLYNKILSYVWPIAIFMGVIIILMALLENNAACQFQFKASDFKTMTITWAQAVCYSTHLVTFLLMIYLSGVILHRIYMVGNEKNKTLYDSFVFVGKKYFQIASSMMFILLVCVLGTLAFIVPGIFLFILFIMVQPLILFDNKGWYEAFKDSCKLVWGNWWRTFAVIFPLLFLNYFMGFISQNFSTGNYWWPIVVVTSLIIALIYPLFYSLVVVQFGDLKVRHQKRGIQI